MAISEGDRIPSATLKQMGANGPEDVSTDDIFKGKKVVLFAVPGAFTPGCSQAHLPGFVANADKVFEKGVDEIVCLATNDAFVMDAWQKDQNADQIRMVADGNAEFVKKLGLELDASAMGMGTRSKRFALIAEDGVVKWLAVDEKGGVEKSAASEVLEQL